MAGIGFDAKVMEDTSLRLKTMLRDLAYVLTSMQTAVTYRITQMTLEAEGEKVFSGPAWLAMVGNAASYAWNLRFTARARLDDGKLDLCLLPYANKLASMRQVALLLMGELIDKGGAQYWQAATLSVHSDPPVPVQLDGDQWSSTPVKLQVCPGALKVLIPPP